MKKIILTNFLFVIMLILTPNYTFAEINSIDDLMKPYNEVVEEFNNHHNIKICISEEDEKTVYDKINNLSPVEFYNILVKDYQEFNQKNTLLKK